MFNSACIIDDDEVSAFLTEAMLASEDFAQDYFTFLNPNDALHFLRNSLMHPEQGPPPQVIFLDLNMPILSGWDLLDALIPFVPQLKQTSMIYLLTSSVDLRDVRQAQEYDFLSGFLQKPIEEQTIRDILKQS